VVRQPLTMARRLGVTVDCASPQRLAAFWRDVLDYVDDPPPPGYASWADYDRANAVAPEEVEAGATIVDPNGIGPRMFFQRVPEPKRVKNRLHLDIAVATAPPGEQRIAQLRQAAAELVRRGATWAAESADPLDFFIVLRDPEGNEFCLV
ncbi:MAG TPA: VOC family protein, partial [Kineosporiaceae bacterium]|nr:VOC family protein [Kineosporiaceae bacterium]